MCPAGAFHLRILPAVAWCGNDCRKSGATLVTSTRGHVVLPSYKTSSSWILWFQCQTPLSALFISSPLQYDCTVLGTTVNRKRHTFHRKVSGMAVAGCARVCPCALCPRYVVYSCPTPPQLHMRMSLPAWTRDVRQG